MASQIIETEPRDRSALSQPFRLRLEREESFDTDLFGFGMTVGPRIGPDRATQQQLEDWVLRRLIVVWRMEGRLHFPAVLERESQTPRQRYPDATLRMADGEVLGFEVTAATTPKHQRHMTGEERARAAGKPFETWSAPPSTPRVADEIVRAIQRKDDMAGADKYAGLGAPIDLVVYDNTDWGGFLDKRELVQLLRDNEYRPSKLNAVHLLAGGVAYLDVYGSCRSVAFYDAYEIDFAAWSQSQADKIRAGDADGIDKTNVAEEIESLVRRDSRAVRSQLHQLLVHLLKWRHQPEKRSSSWKGSIDDARQEIADLTNESPSLFGMIERPLNQVVPARKSDVTVLDDAYRKARKNAARESSLALDAFPEICPFTLDQILDEDYWPEEDHADD